MTPLRRRLAEDRGSEAIQAAIVTPLLIAFVCLAIAAGRLMMADSKIDAAAEDAAREASIARTATRARADALRAARESLHDQGLHCTSTGVDVDTGGLAASVGQISTVTVTVHCTVPLHDLYLPFADAHTLTSHFTSTVDQFRQRGT